MTVGGTNPPYTPVYGTIISNTYGTGTFTTGSDPSLLLQITELKTKIDNIEKQLLILSPTISLHDKYPALQEAYDAYQLILKLIGESNEKRV